MHKSCALCREVLCAITYIHDTEPMSAQSPV